MKTLKHKSLRCNPIILIIAHKEILSTKEKFSLLQCFKILDNYTIKLICPKGLIINDYTSVVTNIDIDFIDPKWQKTYKMFNRLKSDSFLYNRYKKYTHILFYELDAWVFCDELEYWCNKNYDYIGAPWFEGYNIPNNNNQIVGVGNGGFSLRNVQTSLAVSKRLVFLKSLRKFWFKSHCQAIIRFSKILSLLRVAYRIKNHDSLDRALTQNDLLEDYFWSQVVSQAFSDYRVGSISDAIKFSFEVNPAHLFKLNLTKLPFGCHAWNLYDPEFWKKHIMV